MGPPCRPFVVDEVGVARMLRLLACADTELATEVDDVLVAGDIMRLIGRAASGGDMVAQFRSLRPDVVLIAGDVDGCFGVRVAGALARHRQVPTLLVVEPGAEEEARAECERRGVEAAVLGPARDLGLALAHAALAMTGRCEGGDLVPEEEPAIRTELIGLAAVGFDAAVLLGSAGTPHLLPELLQPRTGAEIPLVVALHHNPRLSDAFQQWVGELAVLDPCPLPEAPPITLPPLTVPGSSLRSDDVLEPDLEAVVDLIGEGGRRLFIGIGSGMGVTRIDALARARAAGGVVAVLDPARCSQPGMPTAVIGAGLADHVVSIPELSWLIAHVSTAEHRLPLAASM